MIENRDKSPLPASDVEQEPQTDQLHEDSQPPLAPTDAPEWQGALLQLVRRTLRVLSRQER
jgi:hypothetical protein